MGKRHPSVVDGLDAALDQLAFTLEAIERGHPAIALRVIDETRDVVAWCRHRLEVGAASAQRQELRRTRARATQTDDRTTAQPERRTAGR